MNKKLEKLYALRAQMSAADLPLDAIDEKIRIEEDKESSWKKDLDEITTTIKTFIQPILKKWEINTINLYARFKEAELSALILNIDGKDVILCQDGEDPTLPHLQPKKMKEAIKVSFPDGMVFFEPQASVTMGKVIKKVGPEKVDALQIKGLITKDPDEYKACQDVGNGYFVNTHSNTATKCRQLEEISRQLGLDLIVEIVPGIYKTRDLSKTINNRSISEESTVRLYEELENSILKISPEFSVDKNLKSYFQFTYNSFYVANVIQRKKFIRVMLNDEYSRLVGLPGVVDAPDAHYGHMNCYYDMNSNKDIPIVVDYITKMLRIPDSSDIPSKIRIHLD